ncbi:hypothetical protein RHGRI_001423 [Rhododendron griersonianum]|uniref:Uncharacterized protein n=1 Tax=Rhododendron griersonianum TaxID=479676 RepID=A0AAV6LLB6_9ERIC|nr:hypothetical protein RHGRI_001423 [Rhododendron griersonianum]
MTLRKPNHGVAKAWLADCLSSGKAMHCSRHAKIRGGQGLASRLLVTRQGNALLMTFQVQGWPRHDLRLAIKGVIMASQADCLSPGKAVHHSRHAKTRDS